MTPSGTSLSSLASGNQENYPSNSIQRSSISIMQAWERQEDIQSTQPHVDVTDSWSSDGGSVSSSCCSSDQLGSGQEEMNYDIELLPNDRQISTANHGNHYRTGASYLKRARIFTSEEAINQAIDRWQAYIRLCTRALGRLRHQLVDAYIPYALEQQRLNRNMKHSAVKSSVHADETLQSAEASRSFGRRQRALRNMLRHSVKVENQRHQSCVSKFALVSNRIATWRKRSSSVRCQYRDPTTTTWEKSCTNQCLPLLQVCAHHLVQLNPAPDTLFTDGSNSLPIQKMTSSPPPPNTSASTVQSFGPHSQLSVAPSSVPGSELRKKSLKYDHSTTLTPFPRTGSKKVPAGRTARVAETSTGATTFSTTNITDIQLPTQYLFRRCAGDESGRLCSEPVIAWSHDARCVQHARCASFCSPKLTEWCSINVNRSTSSSTRGDGIDPGITEENVSPNSVNTHLSIIRNLHTCPPCKHNSDPN